MTTTRFRQIIPDMHGGGHMRDVIPGGLMAPAPIFLFGLLALVRPSLGWSDATFSVGIALGCSYGFMLMAGLPAHLILRRLKRQTLADYVSAFLFALALIVAGLTATEGSPPPPQPDDSSPFAALTLRNGGWIFLLVLSAPLIATMASLFWFRTVRGTGPTG